MEFKKVIRMKNEEKGLRRNNKLTDDKIQQIRNRYTTTKCSYKQLAKEFGVTVEQITKALKGVTKWKPTVLQRFDEKWTEDEHGCHVWNGYKSKEGYGQFRMNGKLYRSHRASFELKKRPLEPGEVVRHKCDKPYCVNVDHLEVGTPLENNNDKIERFRQPWEYAAIDYLEIRFMHQNGVPIDMITRRFGIKKTTLKSRLKDMEMTADFSNEDKVFHYRNRAIHEEAGNNKDNTPIKIIINRIIE